MPQRQPALEGRGGLRTGFQEQLLAPGVAICGIVELRLASRGVAGLSTGTRRHGAIAPHGPQLPCLSLSRSPCP